MPRQATLKLVEATVPSQIEEKSHTYRIDGGEWLPGVTKLLDIQEAVEDRYPLERWQITTAATAAYYVGIAGKTKDEGISAAFDAVYEPSRRGSRIHDGIDSMVDDLEHIPTQSDGGYWYAWSRFLARRKPEIIASEQYVIGDGYGGTFDLDAIVDGKRSLIDTKTGSYRDKFVLQLAGYSDALWRAPKKGGQPVEPMPKFEAHYALMLAADGSYDLKPVEVGKAQLDHFRRLVKIHEQLHAWRKAA